MADAKEVDLSSDAKEQVTTMSTDSDAIIKQRVTAESKPQQEQSASLKDAVKKQQQSAAGKDSKQKWQLPASRWAIAAAGALGGLGLLALCRYAGPRSRFHLPAAEPIAITEGDIIPEGDAALNSESLEDALKSLEGAEPVAASPVDIEGDFFHDLADHIDVVEAHQPKDAEEKRKEAKAAKKAKKAARTVVPPPASEGGEEGAAPKAEKSAVSEADAEDALKKLEGGEDRKNLVSDLLQKMTSSSDSKVADEVAQKASKKKKGKSGKKGKLSEEDKEQAKALLQESLKKLHSEDGEADTSELREKLQKLLGKDDDDDDSEALAEKAKKASESEGDDSSHKDFVKLLSGEQERKHEWTLAEVKKEFQAEFSSDSKRLICGGCKIVAARLTSELSTHDVHESESPAQMIAAKRKAIDATCSSFRHLQVATSSTGLRIQAGEASEENPGKPDAPSRLCHALLEESKFDILTKLIQSKIPEQSYLGGASAASKGVNWERWLCAQRTRVCKRSEVREDDEEQEL